MDLDAVAAGAARDAGGLDPALLGDFLGTAVEAATTGRRLRRAELTRYSERGAAAALSGVPLRATVDLYLSASWRLWEQLPEGGTAAQVRKAALAVLRAADDGVAALCEGYQVARNDLSRRQESDRREVFDALLAGGADAVRVLARAESLGLDLAMPHAVYVVSSARPLDVSLAGRLERALQGTRGDAGVLLAEKHGRTVLIVNAPDAAALQHVTAQLTRVLGATKDWQAAVGRPAGGPDGIRSSYLQALDSLELAARLDLEAQVVDAAQLVVFRVLLRDRPAVAELITSTLAPLLAAKGGPGPLLATMEAYFDTGGNATETARLLHLSVRAVTYRLARVQDLLGVDPGDPSLRFTLHAAVLAARLLNWPASPL
jgi:hypothetical protein